MDDQTTIPTMEDMHATHEDVDKAADNYKRASVAKSKAASKFKGALDALLAAMEEPPRPRLFSPVAPRSLPDANFPLAKVRATATIQGLWEPILGTALRGTILRPLFWSQLRSSEKSGWRFATPETPAASV